MIDAVQDHAGLRWRTRREYMGGLNFEDAYHICESNRWDMEIEEDD